MLTITPTTETVTVTKLALTLTEQEARAILVDPTKFQDDLRAALADVAAASNPNGRNKRGGKSITVSPKSAKRVAEQRARVARQPARPLGKVGRPKKSAAGKVNCPKCGKSLDPRGAHRHIKSCIGLDTAPAA